MGLVVSPSAQQSILLGLAFATVLLSVILLLIAAITPRWMVLELPTTTTITNPGTLAAQVVRSNVVVEAGLLRTCRTDQVTSSCDGTKFPSTLGFCNRSGNAMLDRFKATIAFVIMALIVCVFNLLLSLFYLIRGGSIGYRDKPLVGKLQTNRRKGAVVRLIFTGTSWLFILISISVYGNTVGVWAGCGNHYCNTLSSVEETRARAIPAVPGVIVRQTIKADCGYGVGFGSAVTAFIALSATLFFVLLEYFSRGSEMMAEDADGDRVMPPTPTDGEVEEHPEGKPWGTEHAAETAPIAETDGSSKTATADKGSSNSVAPASTTQKDRSMAPQSQSRSAPYADPYATPSPLRTTSQRLAQPSTKRDEEAIPQPNPYSLRPDYNTWANSRANTSIRSESSTTNSRYYSGEQSQPYSAGYQSNPVNSSRLPPTAYGHSGDPHTLPRGDAGQQQSSAQSSPFSTPPREQRFRGPSTSSYQSPGRYESPDARTRSQPISREVQQQGLQPGMGVRIVPEGDDWEYDVDAELFWSDSQRLYFDDKSGHFYDPDSGMWYNPTSRSWYDLS
jgi:hypothetical protein